MGRWMFASFEDPIGQYRWNSVLPTYSYIGSEFPAPRARPMRLRSHLGTKGKWEQVDRVDVCAGPTRGPDFVVSRVRNFGHPPWAIHV